MNCSVGTCTRTAEVREPLPLCGTCALRVVAAYAAANLGSELQVQVPEPRTADRNLRIKAAADYLHSIDAHEPLSGAELGRRYERPARWGQKIIAELKKP